MLRQSLVQQWLGSPNLQWPVFRIRDVFIGSGSGSCSFLRWLSRYQQKVSFLIWVFALGTYRRYIYISHRRYHEHLNSFKKLEEYDVEKIRVVRIKSKSGVQKSAKNISRGKSGSLPHHHSSSYSVVINLKESVHMYNNGSRSGRPKNLQRESKTLNRRVDKKCEERLWDST